MRLLIAQDFLDHSSSIQTTLVMATIIRNMVGLVCALPFSVQRVTLFVTVTVTVTILGVTVPCYLTGAPLFLTS